MAIKSLIFLTALCFGVGFVCLAYTFTGTQWMIWSISTFLTWVFGYTLNREVNRDLARRHAADKAFWEKLKAKNA